MNNRNLTEKQLRQVRVDKFKSSIRASVGFTKRSLLDMCDYHLAMLPVENQDQSVIQFVNFIKKRIHNDVSILQSKFLAAFEILENGGEIPPFGRDLSDSGDSSNGMVRPKPEALAARAEQLRERFKVKP